MSPRRRKDALLATRRTTNVKLVEPPSCSSASTIAFIGRNSRGNWVAQEQSGLYGGLFVNRAQAVKYALFENGHRPEAVVDTPNVLELSLNSSPLTSERAAMSPDDTLQRRAA